MHRRSPTLSDPTPVIALHCSGAGAGQWRALGEALDARHGLVTPEHYGCDSVGPWTGAHAFTLADEAARTIEVIDRSDCKVHLVGHSYGGAVALRAAIERPSRIASLSLYEPTTPAWYAVTLDRATLRPITVDMTATAHFMRDRYVSFNAPRQIRPPLGD